MLFDYINTVLNSVGLPGILTVNEISTLLNGFSEWWQFLNPQLLASVLITFSFIYSMFFISCVLPFRLFKRLFRLDNHKGR